MKRCTECAHFVKGGRYPYTNASHGKCKLAVYPAGSLDLVAKQEISYVYCEDERKDNWLEGLFMRKRCGESARYFEEKP